MSNQELYTKDELSDHLYDFSQQLLPSKEFIKYGNEACDKIFDMLKQKSGFGLARTYISGSMGKNTSILNSDYDLVIFVNNQVPLFIKVLEDFEQHLMTIPELIIKRKTRFSLKVKYQGYSIDILPAANFIDKLKKIPRFPIQAAQQALKTYKEIEKCQNDSKSTIMPHSFSSSLCETQLRFMRRQSSFIHSLVRLCKFWNMTIFNRGYISGRSTLIELIAVCAGQEEEEEKEEDNQSPSMLDGFYKFLVLIENFDTLDIDFEYNPLKALWLNRWKPNLPGFYDSESESGSSESENGSGSDEEENILPYVREPANPYNNIASGIRTKQMEIFQQSAKETISRLRQVLSDYSELEEDVLDYIFSPSSDFSPFNIPRLENTNTKDILMNDSRFQVWVDSYKADKAGNYQGPKCNSLTYLKEFDYKEMQEAFKRMETLFTVVAQTNVSDYISWADSSDDPFDTRDAASCLWNRMEECIDENIWGVEHEEWDLETKYDEWDVTFIIPITVKSYQTKFCVRITFDIEKKKPKRKRNRRRRQRRN